jgi:acyl carrier protein
MMMNKNTTERMTVDRKHFVTELETLLEVSPGTLREDEHVRDLEHWDSLTLLALLVLADEQLHVQLDMDRLAKCITIGDILKLLEESTATTTMELY